jgi:hypothetical protein
VFGQQFTKAPKPTLDRDDGHKASISISKVQSTNAVGVLIGKAWNALTSYGTYTNQISYDPYSDLIGVVHRTDRTGAGSGRIVYQISDDGGANWGQQRGPVNPTFGTYDATLGRMPNIALANPTKSSDIANDFVSITYNNLIPSEDDFRDVVFVKDIGLNGSPDASQLDSSNVFANASVVDIRNGTIYSLISSYDSCNIDVAKSTDGGATWTKVRVFNDSEFYDDNDPDTENGMNAGWLDVDNNGNVHLVFDGTMRTAPDSITWYFRYQKSTDAGETWSTPSYVDASIAGWYYGPQYQFDCVVDGNGVLHIGAILVDTNSVFSLFDITRSLDETWGATKVTDLRKEKFYFPTSVTDYTYFTLNEPQFAKSADGQTIALKWVDRKENSSPTDTLPDVFTTAKRASGASWGAIRNISNTPTVSEAFTKVARYLSSNGTMMVLYTEFGANELEEASLYFLGDAVVVGVDDHTTSVPKKFSLAQNFPNPFNPTTTINYTVPNVGTQYIVSLRIYDLLGREVATLVNEKKSLGSYQVKWNATGSPSGVYFYKLQAGSFTDVKKMALIK